MSKVSKVKPALFKLEGSAWHWVWLPELAEALGWTPERVITTFRDLVKEVYDGYGKWRVGELHWRAVDGESRYEGDSYCEPPDGQIYVPAGFSNDILQVREWGVLRLKRMIHGALNPPRGALREFYVQRDQEDPRKNKLAIIGFTGEHDGSEVWAPLHKEYPLLG